MSAVLSAGNSSLTSIFCYTEFGRNRISIDMEEEDYKGIIKTIKGYNGLSKDCLVVVMEAFPKFSKDTLQSIVSNEYQKRMRYLYVKTPETVKKFYNLYTEALEQNNEPGIIVRMATDFRICPCLIAKLILQKSFMDDTVSNDNLKISNQVKRLIRDTNLIPDPRLAYEVYLCTLYDDLYSPSVEIMRTSIGQEYEIKLQRELARLGLAFRDEEHLRKFGYDKTPDIKLEIPIAINGFIIHWVESKARFGDNEIHKEYVRNQYSSYWNRFGTGLVVYWFGFVETILQSCDKRFMVQDHFPTNIVHITPTILSEDADN